MKPSSRRLLFREFSAADTSFLISLLNEPAFIANIRDTHVRTNEDALAYIARLTLWCVSLRDGTPIGMCGLLKRDSLPEEELGFAFLEAHSGRGYATESAKACLHHAFENLGKKKVLAIVKPENIPSRRVLEKVGMRTQGLVKLPHDPNELCLYIIEAADH